MRNHVTVASEGLSTRITVVVLDARVRCNVSGQISTRYEAFTANWANLVTNSRVDLFVLLEVAQSGELFAADFTLKRSLARVNAKVNREIVFLSKPSGTEIARERTFAGMSSNVQL